MLFFSILNPLLKNGNSFHTVWIVCEDDPLPSYATSILGEVSVTAEGAIPYLNT